MLVRKLSCFRSLRLRALSILILVVTGCGGSLLPGDEGVSSTLGATLTHQESSANDLLNLAETVQVAAGSQVITGSISGESDVDVFDLGPVAPGDRILVEVAVDPTLRAAIALFDDAGAVLLVNDHQNVYLGRKGPFIDLVIRRPSRSCLVALAGTPGFSSVGGYVLDASIEFPAPIGEPRSDVVLLDFDGAPGVRISTRPPVDIPPFHAGDIDESLTDQTEAIIRRVVQKVREDFEPYNVTILSTAEGAVDEATVTSVHFGRFDPALLGVAEGIDEYNATSGQSAIVFTDTFEAFLGLRPTTGELSQAIANVASHEIGHLLGLVHTEDARDIMDVTASLRALMLDQDFGVAPLYRAVFPIGVQDAAQLLLDSVGGDAVLALGKVRPRQVLRGLLDDLNPWEPPARERVFLSTCGLHGDE